MTSERECGRAGDHASTRSGDSQFGCCCVLLRRRVVVSCRVESSWAGLVPDPGRFDGCNVGSITKRGEMVA